MTPLRPYRCMKCGRRFTAAGAKLAHTSDPHAPRAVICTGNVVIDGHTDNVATREIPATEPDRSAAPTVSQHTGGAS